LSYPAAELLARGADVLYVEYNTGRSTIHREEVEDAIAACQVLLQQRPYKQLTVIGKSLGTMVMSYLLTSLPPDLLSVQAIWMTPVLTLPIFQEQWRKITYPSLFVIGSADPYYDTDRLQQAREAGCEVLVIEGANHGLLIENDVIVSIRAMEQVILSIRTLLDQ
jgi:alpha/beta superfamily hydrolase